VRQAMIINGAAAVAGHIGMRRLWHRPAA
jgi:hypothetical protein